jgi:hypothetical protein
MFHFSLIPGSTVHIKIKLIEKNNEYSCRVFSSKFFVLRFFSHIKLFQFGTGSFKYFPLCIQRPNKFLQFNPGCVLGFIVM